MQKVVFCAVYIAICEVISCTRCPVGKDLFQVNNEGMLNVDFEKAFEYWVTPQRRIINFNKYLRDFATIVNG